MALLSMPEMNLTLTLFLFAAAAFQVRAQALAFDEYQVKAAFLYNFAKFVEWPPGTFAKSSDPIGICIAGQNPFGSTLEDMVQGKKVGGRAFVVRQLSDTQQAGSCQILFIATADGRRTRAWMEALKGFGVLTVGETSDFTAQGGIISFRLEGERVRIQVALEAADHARLRISSKLLSLAQIVRMQP